MELKEFFEENPRAAIAFSGGVDSAYLLYAAKKYGADIKAYYVKTQFQPRFEFEDAKRLAESAGVDLEIIELDILADSVITDNPQNRCYYCKKKILGTVKERALSDGYNVLLDGTNASDSASDRAGMRALEELSVKSPLRECGLTKEEIRTLSKKAGLFTWDKPAYACLATRIATGDKIGAEMLSKIEGAEDSLFKLGFTDFRVRVFCGAARLQFLPEQIEKAVKMRGEICGALKQYFNIILLDLEGR